MSCGPNERAARRLLAVSRTEAERSAALRALAEGQRQDRNMSLGLLERDRLEEEQRRRMRARGVYGYGGYQ